MKNTIKGQGEKIMKNVVRMAMGGVLLMANLVPLAANAVAVGGSPSSEYVPGILTFKTYTTAPTVLPAEATGGSLYASNSKLWFLPTSGGTAIDLTLAGSASSLAIDTTLTGSYADGSVLLGKGGKFTKDPNLVFGSTGLSVVGSVTVSGAGNKFIGDGSGLTNISAVALGAVPVDALSDVIVNSAAESMYIGLPYGLFGASSRPQSDTNRWNTSIGYSTLTLAGSATTSTRNTAVGYLSLGGYSGAITNASQNTTVGDRSAMNLQVGNHNTVIGSAALSASISGSHNNTAVGSQSLFGTRGLADVISTNNVAVGANTMYSITNSSSNVAVGTNAMFATTTGSSNTAVGNMALSANTSGVNNIAVGADALKTNTTGYSNTVVGTKAMSLGAGGTRNVVMGTNGMMASTTGDQNLALGYNVLANNTTGYNNVALGSSSLMMNSTGNGNTAIGWGSLIALTTGKGNIAIGDGRTGGNLQTGNNNIILGNNIAFINPAASNNIVIGNNALVFGGTNTLNIGNYFFGDLSPTGNTSGNFGIGAGAPKAALHISKNWEVVTGPQELLRLEGKNTGTLIRFTSTRGGGLIPDANQYNLATIMAIDENAATPTWGGSLRFATSPSGTTGGSAPVDRMVIASNGDIGIGVAVPGAKLHVVGDLRVDGIITANSISGTIGSGQIANDAVDTLQIKNLAVTSAKLAVGSVGTFQIIDNSITASDIMTGGVASDEIADNTITNADISQFANISVDKVSGAFGTKPGQLLAVALTTPTTQITTPQIDLGSIAPQPGLAYIGSATIADYTAPVGGAAPTYPQISAGQYSGQMLILKVANGGGSVKFENKSSRRLILASPTVTLDSDDTLVLMWDVSLSSWIEISRSLNTKV